jgi:hypothetical protein
MEAGRVIVDPAVLDEWFRNLAQNVEDVLRQLTFNMHETGCSDHADRREIMMLVPAWSPVESVPVHVDRHAKRSTITTCISAEELRMWLFVIRPRVTAEKDLADHGYKHHNAFVTSSLFEV